MKVWGTISYDGVGKLVRYEGNMNNIKYVDILSKHLLRDHPFLRGTKSRGSKYFFQQDNAGPHRPPYVEEFFANNLISVLDWPSQSPDLNLIENVWAFIKGELYKKNHLPRTQEDTWREIEKIWYYQVEKLIPRLYSSLEKRFKKVIELGGHRII